MNAATRMFLVITPVCVLLAGALGLATVVGGRDTVSAAPRVVSRPAAPDEVATPVYSVQFADHPDDWYFDDDNDSSTSFGGDGFRVAVRHGWTFTWPSPYDDEVDGLEQSATSTLPTGTPADARVGVACSRDWEAADEIDYDFTVDGDGNWVVDRTDGPSSDADSHVVTSGTVVRHTTAPLQVTARCDSVGDHRSVSLQLVIDGVTATTTADTAPASGHGFTGALVTYGSRVDQDRDSVYEFTQYSEAELHR